MRGLPKQLGTQADIEHMINDLSPRNAVHFVDNIDDATWKRLKVNASKKASYKKSATRRLETEDRQEKRRIECEKQIQTMITTRSEIDVMARDARKIKEELDDLKVQIAEHRKDGIREEQLTDIKERENSLAESLTKKLNTHQGLMQKLVKMKKKIESLKDGKED